MFIYAHASQLTYLDPGHFCQFGFGFYTDGHDHDVGRIHLARFCLHLQWTVLALLEPCHAVTKFYPDAMP